MIPAAKPIIGDEERAAVDRVLRSGMLAQGPEVAAFEEEFSKFVGGRHCVAMNSGTSALHLGFIAAGIKPGDEVIVPSFSFAATANSVVLAGGVPIFADIDPKTFNLDPDHAESLITKKTKAIMPVHLYGHIAAMDRFEEISKKHGVAIIEDAAQGHLASLNGKNSGEFGVVASFSFYPTKNMTAGEGGMVVTESAEIARMLRLLRNQGQEIRYQNEVIGFNTRMTDIHAAIGRVQLAKLSGWTAQRQANAAYLDANLKGVITPFVAPNSTHSYHQYTIRIAGGDAKVRDEFMKRIGEKGVGSGVYYPTPIHRLPSFNLNLDLPETELVIKECVSLPVHPALSQSELETIVSVVNEVAAAL
ncbi:MAG: DegT/DnrJ/EryC1/StrS family aminotransferase [Actinobacteria bacterium]|jgi:dTDP-4-amino-4,6-dideoxygalactose transaminase|nr:DegT/DnrJ/EryC1/StrS family aminotransferase [Actinomycetota bacterium]